MEIIRWISLMSIARVASWRDIVGPQSSRVSSGTKTIAQDRFRPDDEVRAVMKMSGGIIAHFADSRSSADRLYIEVIMVGIRAAGIVDRLLKIWGRNVSDFEQRRRSRGTMAKMVADKASSHRQTGRTIHTLHKF